MKATNSGLVIAAMVLSGACVVDRRNTPPPQNAARGATMTPADAADMLSEARCDYEAKCNKIGPSATYANRDHCVNVTRNESASRFSSCRYGVKSRDVQSCADEMRGEDCGGVGSVVDVFERAAACRTGKLCLD